jgi:hypothetical protein
LFVVTSRLRSAAGGHSSSSFIVLKIIFAQSLWLHWQTQAVLS